MIIATLHATERYVERFKPQLGATQARRELEALAELGTRLDAAPDWLSERSTPCDYWLELTPDVVAPVCGERIITVIARTGISGEHRAKKKAARRKARAHKRWQNNLQTAGRQQRGKGVEWA